MYNLHLSNALTLSLCTSSDKISILLFQCKECNAIIEQQLNSQNIITYHELNSNHFKIIYQAFLL